MHIEKIIISNFKSIKHLELSNFKRSYLKSIPYNADMEEIKKGTESLLS